MLESKVRELLGYINNVRQNPCKDNSLPENTYYLENGDVMCCERRNGESRYPYATGGFTLWAHSTGQIHDVQGLYNVFRPTHTENDPSVNFFAGIKQKNGEYFPISVMGAAKQLFEIYDVFRCVVFSYSAAYYFADTDFATFVVRLSVAEDKEMNFSFITLNKTDKPLEFCFTSYFEAIIKTGGHDETYEKLLRQSRYMGNGSYHLQRYGVDYQGLVINSKVSDCTITKEQHTAAREDFIGFFDRGMTNAECLKTGEFKNETVSIGKLRTPVASDIYHFVVDANGTVRVDYSLLPSKNKEKSEANIGKEVCFECVDKLISEKQAEFDARFDNLKMHFGKWNNDAINSNVLNNFLRSVQHQVNFCATGDNYMDDLLGVRDVFQQLEQALIWDPAQARGKIIRALGYIDVSGRPPRQFSIPENDKIVPRMDLRSFIDQGNWIISTLFTYLAYTDDYSILDEECGYLVFLGNNRVEYAQERDTVLDHLLRITNFLESNLDHEIGTNCLRALFGDWNDALDGLGHTNDPGKVYGSGVSVMASLHFYQNLREMADILRAIGKHTDKADHYMNVREMLKEGLIKYAIEKNDDGEIRLLHGWGDKRSYKIGSFCDPDGSSRISFAPFAFWAISGMISNTPELRDVIVKNIRSLDSQYGIKTNDPFFPLGMEGVGRIHRTVPGTAENACAYVHASMFSILSMFMLGETEFAWKSLEKSMIISHDSLSKTSFVMPNSYCDNADAGLFGHSAGDWYTGSATVLLKNFIRFGFGIEPNLKGLTIQTPNFMPSDEAEISFIVKGKHVVLKYKNTKSGERKISVDGKELETTFNDFMKTKQAFIPTDKLYDGMEILVTD